MVDRSFAEHLDAEWTALAGLCGDLTEHEWNLPTDCPGWTVKDQLAHVVGTEAHLAGEPVPETGTRPDYVHNELGEFNEAWVHALRDVPGAELLARFVTLTDRRLGQVRAMSDEDLSAKTDSPVGPIPYHAFMGIRLMDCWVHEQDIRGALGRPGGLDTVPAGVAVDRLLSTLGYVVGKRVRPPDGTTVAVRLLGPVPRETTVGVSGGRAEVVESSGEPTGAIVTDAGTFARLAAGRWSAEYAVTSGLVSFEHDTGLARSVVDNLATTP